MIKNCGCEGQQSMIINSEKAEHLAAFFRMFADESRLRILSMLLNGELCVCHLAEHTGLTQSAVSHQLRILKAYRLVKGRKAGKHVFYMLDDYHIARILDNGLDHLNEQTKGESL